MTNFDYEKIPIGYYDKVLLEGLARNRGLQANWHNKKFSKVYEYIANNKNHLDYACGPGTFIGNYSNINSIGVDISEIQINYAIESYGKNFKFFVLDESQNIPFDGIYDVITMIELIEHLDDNLVIQILNDLYDRLEIKGKIVLTTPNFRSTYSLIELLVNIFGKVSYKEQHINKFNEKKLLKLLNKTRFNEIKIEKFLNFGIFLSFFSVSSALRLNNFIEKLFRGKLGYLLIAELKK